MATIDVTAADDGSTIPASPGDEIVVALAENATTGYRWHLDQPDGVLRLVSDGYWQGAETDDAEPVFGRGGLRQFRLEVTGSGTATLSLKHWREWEGDRSVIDRVTLVIDSTPAGLLH
jgi:inhibitor of cysteine peptidase